MSMLLKHILVTTCDRKFYFKYQRIMQQIEKVFLKSENTLGTPSVPKRLLQNVFLIFGLSDITTMLFNNFSIYQNNSFGNSRYFGLQMVFDKYKVHQLQGLDSQVLTAFEPASNSHYSQSYSIFNLLHYRPYSYSHRL